MTIPSLTKTLLACAFFLLLITPLHAQTVYVTNSDIAAAGEKAGLNQSVAQAAADASSNVEDQSGQLNIISSNGMAGLMQMDPNNLDKYCRCSPQEYANSSVDEQMAVWAKFQAIAFDSAAIKETETMTTFDGQPVDDAFRLACIQLGVGNCQDVLSSGSCADRTDGNGVNICQYAAKLRSGNTPIGNTSDVTNVTGNTTNTNAASVQQDVNVRSINGVGLPMGNPIYCWSCDIIAYSMAATEAAATTGLTQILTTIMPFLVIMAMFGVIYRIGVAVVAGIDPISYTLPTAIRAVFVLCFLANGGSIVENILLNYLMIPSLDAGTDIGQTIGNDLAVAFNVPVDNITVVQGAQNTPLNSDCTFNAEDHITLQYLQEPENAAESLACSIHRAMTTEVQIGVFMANSNQDAATYTQKIQAAAINIAGLLMTSLGAIGMLKFAMIFLDVTINMGIIMAFAPWSIYAWIFDSTRVSTKVFLKEFLHATITFACAGIASTAALIVVLTTMQAGLGIEGNISPSLMLITAESVVNDMSLNNGSSVAVAIQFCLYTMTGTLAAGHILSSSKLIANMVVGMVLHDNLSNALMGAISTTIKLGMGGVGGIAGLLAGAGGRGAAAAAKIMPK